jgi:hypothetical protein
MTADWMDQSKQTRKRSLGEECHPCASARRGGPARDWACADFLCRCSQSCRRPPLPLGFRKHVDDLARHRIHDQHLVLEFDVCIALQGLLRGCNFNAFGTFAPTEGSKLSAPLADLSAKLTSISPELTACRILSRCACESARGGTGGFCAAVGEVLCVIAPGFAVLRSSASARLTLRQTMAATAQ